MVLITYSLFYVVFYIKISCLCILEAPCECDDALHVVLTAKMCSL